MGDDWFVNAGNTFINPEPLVLKETDNLVNDFLSPAKLREITGKNDLTTVDSIEMMVNTSETTLGNFGQYLTNLTQLKLNDSFIPSVRDIGTSFSCLTVLWMSRSKVDEIDGIASMQSLQELYVAYNNIADLSPISFLENLEILDLEGNKVSDVDQIDYMKILCHLSTLTLSGNPVCLNFCSKSKLTFREYALQQLPQLQQLDDISAKILKPDHVSLSHCQEDIDIITNAIKDGIDIESNLQSVSPDFFASGQDFIETHDSGNLLPPTFSVTPLKKLTTIRPATAAASAKRRPVLLDEGSFFGLTCVSPRPESSGSDNGLLVSDDMSNLTIGDPLCGNPLQALKQRKRSPMPAFNFLSNDYKNFSSLGARPSTSLGLRQSFMKFGCKNSLSTSEEISSTLEEQDFVASEPDDISSSSKDMESSFCKVNFTNNFTKPSGLSKFKSPSPPLTKVNFSFICCS